MAVPGAPILSVKAVSPYGFVSNRQPGAAPANTGCGSVSLTREWSTSVSNDITASALADILYLLTRPAPVAVRDPQPYQWATIEPGGGPAPAVGSATGPHWAGTVVRALLDRALAEDRDGSTAQLVVNKLDLGSFVDDLCGEPATWPVPLPLPGGARWWPDSCLPGGALRATDLLVAAAHLHHAADRLDGAHPVRADLAAAADRLFDTGLSRLAEEAKHQAKIEAKIQAKHESATFGLQQTQIILAKHQ